MLDLLITGGTVLDGTGAQAVAADIGVRDGRLVAVEPSTRPDAARTIDATGLVVAPGFVDVHTHYDAQLFWDPALTPSCFHGFTTAFGGNCGFSIAPLPEDADYLMRLLSRVEGIPLEALEAGVPWNWRTFPEYLDTAEQHGTALNFGVLAGHSALRRTVLGERSGEAEISPAELDEMRTLLRGALEAGAWGFSSSWASTHHDGNGDPVPSRASSAEELVALCEVLGSFSGTQVEFIPTNGPFEEVHLDVMTRMSLAAKSTLNWNILIPRDRAWVEQRLGASDYARERGARIVALSYPDVIRSHISFRSTAFDSLPGWAPIMAKPYAEKIAALSDPETRTMLREGAEISAARGMPPAIYRALVVSDTHHPDNAAYRGRKIGEIAEQLGRDPFDVLCDIVVADDLRTVLIPQPPAATDEAWELRRENWTDPRVVIGASDAGAHLDMLTTFDYPVRFLALVREHPELTLPTVVAQLTDIPARLYGLRERGRIVPGWWADLVLFDPETIDAGPVDVRSDMPAGAERQYAEPTGIAHVIVNGVEIVSHGKLTGERPGALLRRGVDTVDVEGSV